MQGVAGHPCSGGEAGARERLLRAFRGRGACRSLGVEGFVVIPLDQLRLRLTDHDFDRLMQAAKPVRYPTATPSLRTLRRSLASTKWSAPVCCIGS